jgi:RNA polymerase sigma-70 factor, ECF subfamily
MQAHPEIGSWNDLAAKLRPFIVRRVASTADADDVLQEVLIRVHRGLPNLRDDDRLSPWLFRIARNAVTDHFRTRTTAEEPDQEQSSGPLPEGDEPDDHAARAMAQALARFIAELPSPYREAITLTELEGRAQREAAEMLGISWSGMKSRVQRGRAKLREMLERCCEIALDARGHVIACRPREGGGPPSGCAC